MPIFSAAWKFYYLPFRTFEITAGGLLTIWRPKITERTKSTLGITSISILIVLMCVHTEVVSGSLMLILTVCGTLLFLIATDGKETKGFVGRIIAVAGSVGKRSYSIYIWHQIIVAFLFYSLFPKQNIVSFLTFVALTVVISIFSYRFIEVPLGKTIGKKGKETVVIIVTGILMTCLCWVSILIYRNSGVVRDVPELNVYRGDVHRGMHAEYCDKPYAWDRDFVDDFEKKKILVIGNNFGRDWANILYEWDSNDALEISYIYFTGDSNESDLSAYSKRIEDADYVFLLRVVGLSKSRNSCPVYDYLL